MEEERAAQERAVKPGSARGSDKAQATAPPRYARASACSARVERLNKAVLPPGHGKQCSSRVLPTPPSIHIQLSATLSHTLPAII